jgi:hypothetical protein
MQELNKEIKIDNKNIIKYEIIPGYVPLHIITYVNLENGIKTITLSRWDDYSFVSYQQMKFEDYDGLKREKHIINKSNPLYIPLLHLLNGEEELIIDDDDTSEINKKYMKVYTEDDNINVEFINELGNSFDIEKFNVFIKNIFFDLRSKIDSFRKDTKERLYFFFDEVLELFMEENHQISIEEYLLDNGLLTKEESKKYVKKWNHDKKI